MTDCMEAPDHAPKFDDKIYVMDKFSTYLCIVKSENGMQTGETLLEYIECLVEQVKARSKLEVKPTPLHLHRLAAVDATCACAAWMRRVYPCCGQEEQYGRPPIKFPIFLGGDNHASRFGPDVLAALSDKVPRLGVRGWLETSNASQFLQWLDQINQAFHSAYNTVRYA